MNARDDGSAFASRRGAAVRGSAGQRSAYDLAVLATDPADVVRAAGGWLYDRVRAGWHVTVCLQVSDPAALDLRGLTILGVRGWAVESAVDGLALRPAAVALTADLLGDDRCRAEIVRAGYGGATEVTVWGDPTVLGTDIRFGPVRHRLSAAARAFKRCALATVSGAGAPAVPDEDFVSAALWYPSGAADLEPRG